MKTNSNSEKEAMLFATCYMHFIFFIILTLCSVLNALSQIPQGFNYQAIARDASGNPITGTTIKVKLSILSDTTGFYLNGGTYIWEEEHTNVKTNSFGMFTVVLGSLSATKVQGSAASFSAIDWSSANLFIGTKIAQEPAYVYKVMGSAKLWSVPYSMLAKSITGSVKKLTVAGETSDMEEALFEVKNKTGQTVFAVYSEGVRVYVDDGNAKGKKGGFAIGGFGTDKGISQTYMLVKPDTVRIYIDDTPNKATKGGFAIGGFSTDKGNINYFNVATDNSGLINPAQNRILWYPLKNAFLSGKVLIQSASDVGENSFAAGYTPKAKGMYSQAMGYQPQALGNYSTAIGKNAFSQAENSFAFGNGASALSIGSYAFGTGAQATAPLSFALGSIGVDSTNKPTGSTIASGYGAFAIGFGSVASGQGAFTAGVIDTASGPFSLAMGYGTASRSWFSTTMGFGTVSDAPFSTATGLGTKVEGAGWCGLAAGVATKAGNWSAVAFGDRTYASGHTSFAAGFNTTASGHLSTTFGNYTTASGFGATALGNYTYAQAYGSLAIGSYNTIAGNTSSWNFWDPVFVVGNGTSASNRSNAFTVYNSGIADIGSFVNLCTKTTDNRAIMVNSNEALWFDGTYFSWGYGGNYNYFARPVTIGNASAPGYMLYVNGNAYTTGTWAGSDIRWKKNLQSLENVTANILKLNSYRYTWRTEEYPEMNFDTETHIGLIAQEVEKVFPELVKTDSKGFKAVSYETLSVVLLEGIKEQQKEIEELRKMVEELQSIVAGNR